MTEFINVRMKTTATYRCNIAGWTCAHCGGYVTYGQTHYCAAHFNYQPQFLPYVPQVQITYPDPTLIEIRDLLKQLIELMESNEKTT